MRLTKEDIGEIIEFLENTDDYKPLVKKAMEVIQEFAIEIKPLLEKLSDYISDSRVKRFKWYIEQGLTREEAMAFCIADIQVVKSYANNIQNVNNKKESI